MIGFKDIFIWICILLIGTFLGWSARNNSIRDEVGKLKMTGSLIVGAVYVLLPEIRRTCLDGGNSLAALVAKWNELPSNND